MYRPLIAVEARDEIRRQSRAFVFLRLVANETRHSRTAFAAIRASARWFIGMVLANPPGVVTRRALQATHLKTER